MAKNFGVDVGFGFTKSIEREGKVLFPSVVGEAHDIRYQPGFNPRDPLNKITVDLEGDRFFLGRLAIKQSSLLRNTLSKERIISRESRALFLAALGILFDEEMGVANMVTGLPVDEYTEFKDQLQEMLLGPHNFRINGQNKIVRLGKVRVIPQPFGTVFNLLLTPEGEIADQKLGYSRLGVIDIGFRTSDFCVSDNLEFIDHLSSTSTVALKDAYDLVSRGLNEQFGINRSPYQLEESIREKKVGYQGSEVDIEELVEDAYSTVARKVVSEVVSRWPERWDLDRILVTGGGGITLFNYLAEELKNLQLVEKGQFSNASGYLKVARRSWGE